jgi:ABC-type transporter MlaC component
MDFDTVSMHTLGRYGRKPDGRDFEEFSLLFSAHIIDLAIERFGNLPIRGYAIASSNKLPNGDVLVNTTVARDGGDPLKAGWRVRQFMRGPLIIDIEVDGYSMTTHFRGQWQDWLSKAGLEGMVEKLRGMTRNSPSVALARTHRRG